jgi:hypothetical protein
MGSHGSDAAPEIRPAREAPRVDLSAVRQGAKDGFVQTRWLVPLAGLLAGLIAFGVGEAIYKVIPVELVLQDVMMTNQKVMLPSLKTENAAMAKNAALAFAVLGVCLGGLLGMAGGLARRSMVAAVTAGLLGATLGLVLGAGLSLLVLPFSLQAQFDYFDQDLLIALVTHALICGLLGASAGLAFAVGLGERRLLGQALTAGLMGAVLGAGCFELIGAAFFASAATVKPISETWPTRLLAQLLMTIGTATSLGLLPLEPRKINVVPESDTARQAVAGEPATES